MNEVYDRDWTAALIEEARKLTAAVKIEADETTTNGARMIKWRFWR